MLRRFAFLFIVAMPSVGSTANKLPPFYKNYYSHLCRRLLQDVAVTSSQPFVLRSSMSLLNLNREVHTQSTHSQYDISSHLAVHKVVEDHGDLILEIYTPVVRAGNFPEMLATLEKQHRDTYQSEVESWVSFALNQMKIRQGFKNTEGLLREAPNFIPQSIQLIIKDKTGRVVGTFRILDAPFGVKRNLNIYQSMKPIWGHFGPSVAQRELAPQDYLKYLHGIEYLDELLGHAGESWNAGLVDEMLNYGDSGIHYNDDRNNALGFYLENHVGIQNAEGGIPRPLILMMEKLHRDELIAAGFKDGLLPRMNTSTFFADDQRLVSFDFGTITELGNLAVLESLDPIMQDRVLELIFSNCVLNMFNPIETPFTNIVTRTYYTYGGEKARMMYAKLGFTPLLGKSILFNGEAAYILQATPVSFLLGILETYPRLKQKLGSNLRELIQDILKDVNAAVVPPQAEEVLKLRQLMYEFE